MEPFKKGDKVRIIKYGSLIWMNKKAENPKVSWPIVSEDENRIWYDPMSQLIGKEGIIEERNDRTERLQYSIRGIPGKHAWYNGDQLELIE